MLFVESTAEFKKLQAALAMISEAAVHDLRSVEFVERVIETAGRTPDRRSVYADGPYHGVGSLHQKPAELARALLYLSDKGVASYIEVGCSKGSTLAVITAYLSRLNPVASVGVDIRPRVSWKRVESVVNVKFHVGTSDFFKGQKFDLCFVDGYHSFEWCERDFENVGKFSKFCMFHDIYDRYCPEVGVYYNQVKNNNSVEFSSPPHDTMGIGILTL